MFRFENPLDPSKDGMNPLIDGIRYNIRNSELIKEKIINNPSKSYEAVKFLSKASPSVKPLAALEYVLYLDGYTLDDLIVADEHELLNWISQFID